MNIKLLVFLFTLISGTKAYCQIGNSDSLQVLQIRANQTDSNIAFELATHYVFYNPTAQTNHTLLVFLPGSFDSPKNTTLFPSLAANNGFHVINLKYENGIATKSACGNDTDSACFYKFRKEIIEGGDFSPNVSVDSTNSILNRTKKLLAYLHSNYPNHNWDQFYTTDLSWNKIIFAGHSQGGGHAAYFGTYYDVNRVLMFSSPNDFSDYFNRPAPWTSEVKLTANERFFGFNNLNDDVVDFDQQLAVWNNLKFDESHDTSCVDGNQSPYANSRKLYTQYQGPSGISVNHSSTVRDEETPKDSSSNPIFKPVWEYMIGINQTPGSIYPVKLSLDVFPNPTTTSITLPDYQDAEISIYSTLGMEMAFLRLSENSIDVSDFPSGTYFVVIRQGLNQVHTRFIKQ